MCQSNKKLNLDLSDHILLSCGNENHAWTSQMCKIWWFDINKCCNVCVAQKDQMLCYSVYIMNYLSRKHMRRCLYQHLGGKRERLLAELIFTSVSISYGSNWHRSIYIFLRMFRGKAVHGGDVAAVFPHKHRRLPALDPQQGIRTCRHTVAQ